MTTNELTKRITAFLAGRVPGTIELKSYASVHWGRHGSCHCCRYYQFMSDTDRAGVATFLYPNRTDGLSYTVVICERCVRVANGGVA
jgi:hypothetical protein